MTNTIEQTVEGTELAKNYKFLILLRDELYFGSWDRMETDLRDRVKSRPYIFKIVNQIEQDLTKIEVLKSYELKHDCNLSDCLKDSEE